MIAHIYVRPELDADFTEKDRCFFQWGRGGEQMNQTGFSKPTVRKKKKAEADRSASFDESALSQDASRREEEEEEEEEEPSRRGTRGLMKSSHILIPCRNIPSFYFQA